ncbi:diadenylate cyclase [Iamia majanohamensis]|uniref:Diadenylate cyclase n=1 Tax=Iamia majanohamensis TaxID=467976 RepID=A0AAE9Y439_9ACTN|nr:diadenylate cyclase [Iamia majanohamensis]WCO66230.1 diadenylate cyclase [Iamia majanohamensis]
MQLDGPARRLKEEMRESGVHLDVRPEAFVLAIAELDHARRPPLFEGRRSFHCAIVLDGATLDDSPFDVEVIDIPHDLDTAREMADGRSSFVLRRTDTPTVGLACFEQPLQFESDLVRLHQATGALLVQRTARFEVVRLFADDQVVTWDGRSWRAHPTASELSARLVGAEGLSADARLTVDRVLELALHWLSPSRAGATFVIGPELDGHHDRSATVGSLPLSVRERRHFAPLRALLSQRDLATTVDPCGQITAVGVGLHTSDEANREVVGSGGMRHRSAQRTSYDHPDHVIVVVSEDGPVTVYRAGQVVAASEGTDPPV